MFQRILVPVDGSTFSEQAIPYATKVAAAFDARLGLALVHVTSATLVLGDITLRDTMNKAERELQHRETEYLNELAGRVAEATGRAVDPIMLSGEVVPALEHEIKARGADLVIMATHGRAGLERAWLGSVADALIRHVATPVLLIRPSEHEPILTSGAAPRFEHVLLALDGSERAERAFAPAAALAGADTARVTLMRVVAPPRAMTSPFLPHAVQFTRKELQQREQVAHTYIEEKVRELKLREIEAAGVVLVDYHPAHAVLQFANANSIDLIALGTRGHGVLSRLMLGSVSDKVVRAADVPVLVC